MGGFKAHRGEQGDPISKIQKSPIQNGGPIRSNPLPTFQHSNSIRKCLKIGDFWGGFRPPHRGWGTQFKKIEKKPYTECWSKPTAKISAA